MPEDVLTAFKKNVENGLKVVQASKDSLHWIDMDRLMDQSITMFLRFNTLFDKSPLALIYYAWTLYSVDTVDFDQMYLTLKLMMPRAKQIVTFTYPSKHQTIFKKIREVMQNIHDRFAAKSNTDTTQRDVENDFTDKMNAVGGFNEAQFLEQD